jgi:outer membrane protein insertion porin family
LLLGLAALACWAAGCAAPRPVNWGSGAAESFGPAIEMPGAAQSGQAPVGQAPAGNSDSQPIVRGQEPSYGSTPINRYETTPGSTDYSRRPVPVSGGEVAAAPAYPSAYQPPPQNAYAPPAGNNYAQPPLGYAQPAAQPQAVYPQPGNFGNPPLPPPPVEAMQGTGQPFPAPAPPVSPVVPGFPWLFPPSNLPQTAEELGPPPTPTDIDVFVDETRTGKLMFGVGVNSNAGVTGQITLDERNFDITRYPGSVDDIVNGTAWRGAGQGFRLEAQPGNQLQRYMISFTDPYFLNTNVSMSTSGFYFTRNYYDWTEARTGGRLQWGYRLTPDLSGSFALRAESVNLFNPRVLGVPELDAALGRSSLYSGQFSLLHDTRDLPFIPTEGHLVSASYEQVFGTYSYPRGELNYNQYFMLRERPDGSGRHTLAFSTKVGVSGSQTPIYDNYFAGGFSTLRGFAFRGASPINGGVRVGGRFEFINSVEYFFPLTADDMIKGVAFCDFGTVEQDVQIKGENFRVSPGFGLRVAIPALGPAPLALDFAFPIAQAAGDQKQTFSFFFGASRGQ